MGGGGSAGVRTGQAGLAAALLAAGCPSLGAYVCATDDDCNRGGVAGVCLADRACAYPDDGCDSGLRRSPNASTDPGACVSPGGDDGVADDGSGDGGSTMGGSEGGSGSSGPGTSADDGAGACGSAVSIAIDVAALVTDSALSGYPIYIRTDDAALVEALTADEAAPWFSDEAGTALPFEVTTTEREPGVWSAFVTLPEHDVGATVMLRLQWGDGGGPAGDATAVWSAYEGVWHFDDPLFGVDGDPAANAAVPAEPGAAGGTMQADQAVRAIVGGGWQFDGVDDTVVVDAAWIGTLDAYGISLWARQIGDTPANLSSYFHRLNGTFFMPRCWRLEDGQIICQWTHEDGTVVPLGADTIHADGEEHLIALSHDPALDKTWVYIDGQPMNESDDPDVPLEGGDYDFEIGNGEWGSASAVIDEVRVSSSPLRPAWVLADYRSQLDPTLAVTIGPVEPLPCG